jgi:hypothetical protein
MTLFLLLIGSVLAASLTTLAQTETYSSQNYRQMAQARYGGEAGIEQAANYLMFTYAAPSTSGGANGDVIASYNTAVSPVTYNGNPVILSANAAVASNYPIAAVKAAFAGLQNNLTAGLSTVGSAPYATLMSMEEVPAAQSVSANPFTIQTWQITSDGTITTGARVATVEVMASIDTQKLSTSNPALNYAAFATSGNCGALTFKGGMSTNSYNSTLYNPGNGANITAANGGLANNTGNVGTNGNLTDSGGSTVNGNLSTPRVGVGNCSAGNVDANTSAGGATVTGGIVQLPQAITLVTPNIATPNLGAPGPTAITIKHNTTCASLVAAGAIAAANCAGAAGNLTFSGNLTLGDLTVQDGTLTLASGNYTLGNVSVGGTLTITGGAGDVVNMQSFSTSNGGLVGLGTGAYNTASVSLGGGATVNVASQNQVAFNVIDSFTMLGNSTLNVPADYGLGNQAAVSMNVVNTAGIATPIDLSGGTLSNASYDASRFQIQYGGTGTIKMAGGTQQAAAVYAPNSPVTLKGGADLYGEVIASTVDDSGGANIHYDKNLMNKGLFSTVAYQPGNTMMTAFTWKKF